MKKFLLIGAMLILGATSFSSVISEIEESTNKGSGKGSLGLITRGNSVDIANDVYLEIIPTVSAGPDRNSLEFNFGDLTPTSSAVLTGKFTAQVLNKTVPVKLSDSTITVEVKDDREHKKLKNTAGATVGTIEYTKAASSGLVNSDLTYNGVITSRVNIGAKVTGNDEVITPEGTFLDTGAYVKVTINNLELPK